MEHVYYNLTALEAQAARLDRLVLALAEEIDRLRQTLQGVSPTQNELAGLRGELLAAADRTADRQQALAALRNSLRVVIDLYKRADAAVRANLEKLPGGLTFGAGAGLFGPGFAPGFYHWPQALPPLDAARPAVLFDGTLQAEPWLARLALEYQQAAAEAI